MNKKVWNDDKTTMYFINTTANKILSLADGKKSFSNLVTKAFAGSKIGSINNEALENFDLETQLNDRFLQSTIFCISMWERQLLKFKISKTNAENVFISPLLAKVIDSNGDLSVEKAYRILSKEDETTEYKLYNQFKANLALLFAYDMVLVKFTGSIEDCDDTVVVDSDLPQYKIGYLKPDFSADIAGVGTRGIIAGAALSALVGKVIDSAPEIGTTAGKIVGEMESR